MYVCVSSFCHRNLCVVVMHNIEQNFSYKLLAMASTSTLEFGDIPLSLLYHLKVFRVKHKIEPNVLDMFWTMGTRSLLNLGMFLRKRVVLRCIFVYNISSSILCMCSNCIYICK